MLAGRLAAWQLKQQTVVTQSTAETKSVALAACVIDFLWIKELYVAFDGISVSRFYNRLFDVTIMKNKQGSIQKMLISVPPELSKLMHVVYQCILDHIALKNIKIKLFRRMNPVVGTMTKNVVMHTSQQQLRLLGMLWVNLV